MIHTRKDGTFIIEVNEMPYHVIESDKKYWSEVKKRINNGEKTEQEIPESPGNDYKWNSNLEEWILDSKGIIKENNNKNLLYLKETDWVVISAMETGKPIPKDISAKRQLARDNIIDKIV